MLNNPKHADMVKLSPFLFQKRRHLHHAGVCGVMHIERMRTFFLMAFLSVSQWGYCEKFPLLEDFQVWINENKINLGRLDKVLYSDDEVDTIRVISPDVRFQKKQGKGFRIVEPKNKPEYLALVPRDVAIFISSNSNSFSVEMATTSNCSGKICIVSAVKFRDGKPGKKCQEVSQESGNYDCYIPLLKEGWYVRYMVFEIDA